MKVEIFTPVVYYGDAAKVRDYPVAPRLYDSEHGAQSIRFGYEQMEAAYEAGFDSLNLAEHHYSTSQMTPVPHLFAAALGERLPDAQIGLFGTDLPLHNPLFVAEQYAMLDNLLDGRLRFALLRGTANEYLTYGTNPWESRERFEEAVQLIIRAFTEPEPFGWEGRYFRYRNIALFPQPVQRPHPRILLSANSIGSARFAGRMRCDAGISFFTPDKAAPLVAAYREAAAEAGWTPTADNILYRQVAYVAETDEQAREESGDMWGQGLFGSHNPDLMRTIATAGAALAGAPKGAPVGDAKPPRFGQGWIGAPDTVLTQIREVERQLGMGRVELVLVGPVGSVSHSHPQVLRTIKLIGQELIPALHGTAA